MATEPITTELAGSCVGPNGGAIGMPQLCADWFPNQVFWLIIALVAIYFILTRIGLPRVGGVLAERQGTITNHIAAAEELKIRAQEAEKAYDKALADARAEAGRIVAAAKADIQKDLDAAMAKADEEIAAKSAESEAAIDEIRKGAMAAIEEVAKDTAGALVTALGGSGDQAAIDGAVEARLKG
ncbi:F0F1 ATP synthase subunit B' [Oceaniglobus roseus]|uniref:F0F1 ATP synthase subunit B' n=1 Tax=Oceaniglobus roseus TaxID=1737570 RepID=UPI000C7E9FDB|nr:F0F1 ATP synthase subunit B' [Kandeliimicrobium roseum]